MLGNPSHSVKLRRRAREENVSYAQLGSDNPLEHSLHRDLTDLAAQLVNGGRERDLIQLLVAAAERCWVSLS